MSIVVVGSIAFDTVKTPFGEAKQALGGAANYFSVCASFFSSVRLVGVVGEDFPTDHFEFLQTRGVDIAGVKNRAGQTFHWQGQYGYDLNEPRTLKTELNVFADFSPELPKHYLDSDTLFLANIDPVLQLKVLDQMHRPKLVALDTMNYWIEGKNEDLKQAIKRVHILFINESELRQLTKEHNVVKAVRVIQQWGPDTVVVKRGEYGALLFQGVKNFFVPAYPLEDLYDPTGAGDTFAGGFLGWLDHRGSRDFDTMKEAMTLGSVMASFVIEDFSFNRLRSLSKAEIEERCLSLQRLSTASRPIEIRDWQLV